MTTTPTRGRYRKSGRLTHPLAVAVAFVVGVVLLIGACSADTPEPVAAEPETVESVPETTETTVTPEPEPEPEPKALSIEQAADRYLQIVAPVNAAATESEALANASGYRGSCEVMVEPSRESIDEFASTKWPGDVARLVTDQLVPLVTDEVAAYESCASASERQAEDIYWSTVYDAWEARSPVSSAIRTLLGLPQVTS